MIEKPEPDRSAVFDMTNGEKVRIDYEQIFLYRSSSKAKNTVVELGYGSDREVITLDVSFDSFDEKYQANRKAWRDYWNSQGNNSLY